ncbi:MAG: hypothetical protein QOJ65_92 [Fimbriimonadaceae bacterium]|jgi:hypothetical protein|nr:hypothetical protein [Fimbriimonadaceae bacterium]
MDSQVANGLKWALPITALVVIGTGWMAAKKSGVSARSQKAMIASSYPKPEVEILAQPLSSELAYANPTPLTEEKPRKRRRKRHEPKPEPVAEVASDPAPDANMGVMAADDPSLKHIDKAPESDTPPPKQKKDGGDGGDWKNWIDDSNPPPQAEGGEH